MDTGIYTHLYEAESRAVSAGSGFDPRLASDSVAEKKHQKALRYWLFDKVKRKTQNCRNCHALPLHCCYRQYPIQTGICIRKKCQFTGTDFYTTLTKPRKKM